jgi:hypothetical protein
MQNPWPFKTQDLFDFLEDFELEYDTSRRKRYWQIAKILETKYVKISAEQNAMKKWSNNLSSRGPNQDSKYGPSESKTPSGEKANASTYAELLDHWYYMHVGGER